MEKVELICTTCPLGCNITVSMENGEIMDIKGNSCPRGKTYAAAEVTMPMRTLTSTVRAKNGVMVPVKTDKPIEKARLMECMDQLRGVVVNLPVHIGDIIIKDIASGANLVATKDFL